MALDAKKDKERVFPIPPVMSFTLFHHILPNQSHLVQELPSGTINGSFNVPTPIFKQADKGDLDRVIHEHIRNAKEVKHPLN